MFTENHYQLQNQYAKILPTLSTNNRSSRILRPSNNQRLQSATIEGQNAFAPLLCFAQVSSDR